MSVDAGERDDARSAVRVRPARSGDAPVLLSMMQALAALEDAGAALRIDLPTLRGDGFGPSPRFHALLAEVAGVTVGYVSYSLQYSIWAGCTILAVDDLYVDQAHRSRGAGRRLMEEVRAICIRDGHAFVRWTVELDNPRAIAFYERLGARLHGKGVCTWLP
jgi:GNAT superfamily N-acetyltransferase